MNIAWLQDIIFLALLIGLGSFASLAAPARVAAWSSGTFSSTSERELIALTNRSRASAGLRSLRVDSTLTSVARWRSKDMIERDYFSHDIPGYGSVFKKLDMAHDKLSAFLPVAKSMLDLGPAWMDRYTRAVLQEALSFGLEEGIVNGTGKNMPIGANRQVGTGVVVTDGVYPRKSTVAVTKFDPATYATLLATLTTGPNSKARKVARVALIVNPTDYVGKIFPATTIRGADGKYINDVFPFPTDVYQSVEVPSGKAIFGLPARYFMGIGTAKTGKIEYSDEYHFLEDERIYLVKLYGHGEPLDNNAFIYLDISGMAAAVNEVKVTNLDDVEVQNLSDIVIPAYPDARLASLKIGALTLTPAFNKSTHNYTLATTDATNTITAVAKDGEGTIEILNGSTAVANGAAATWATGANTLTITVTVGSETEVYTVTVTKS
jgi:hypothetical protein